MLSIKNREQEDCSVWMVDMNGYICYEGNIKPNDDIELDIKTYRSGIYTLIFKTEHTSYKQNVIKY
jgi:hypothetical protein